MRGKRASERRIRRNGRGDRGRRNEGRGGAKL